MNYHSNPLNKIQSKPKQNNYKSNYQKESSIPNNSSTAMIETSTSNVPNIPYSPTQPPQDFLQFNLPEINSLQLEIEKERDRIAINNILNKETEQAIKRKRERNRRERREAEKRRKEEEEEINNIEREIKLQESRSRISQQRFISDQEVERLNKELERTQREAQEVLLKIRMEEEELGKRKEEALKKLEREK